MTMNMNITMTMTIPMRRPMRALFTMLLRLRRSGLTNNIYFSLGRDGLRRPSRQGSHSNLEAIELIAVITSSQVPTCQYQLSYSIVICDLSGLSVVLRD
jgi:hypothetical protein